MTISPNNLDRIILRKLPDYGFDIEYVIKSLLTNKHNHATTTYYLLLKKRSGLEPLQDEMDNEKKAKSIDLKNCQFMKFVPKPPDASRVLTTSLNAKFR